MQFISAQPYDYELPTQGTIALMVIDMQRDFMEPGGFGESLGNDVNQLGAIVPTTQTLLAGFRALRLPIFHTMESHLSDLSDCPPAKRRRGNHKPTIGDLGPMGRILVRGEPGNSIISALAPQPGEQIILKPGKGAFYSTNLELLLRAHHVTHLVLAGVTTEVCVQTTMREANDRGYECLLVEDATASYFPTLKQATLEMVRAQGGIVGWTTSTEMVLKGLQAWRSRG